MKKYKTSHKTSIFLSLFEVLWLICILFHSFIIFSYIICTFYTLINTYVHREKHLYWQYFCGPKLGHFYIVYNFTNMWSFSKSFFVKDTTKLIILECMVLVTIYFQFWKYCQVACFSRWYIYIIAIFIKMINIVICSYYDKIAYIL